MFFLIHFFMLMRDHSRFRDVVQYYSLIKLQLQSFIHEKLGNNSQRLYSLDACQVQH